MVLSDPALYPLGAVQLSKMRLIPYLQVNHPIIETNSSRYAIGFSTLQLLVQFFPCLVKLSSVANQIGNRQNINMTKLC